MVKKFVENYEQMSDEELVAEINGGKFELLRLIISRYSRQINYYVNRYCSENEKEDAVQEATFALYSAVKSFNGGKSSFRTFADLCIKRSVMNGLRLSKRGRLIPDELLSPLDDEQMADCNSPEKIVIDRESYRALKDSIRLELSVLEYSVLEQFLSGKKYAEIAIELSISEKSVNNALLRIRKKLKNK